MNKYRLKYKKCDEAKYISHLDFVRAIGRTFKRAKLPVKYSQGFNPHIIMTVGLPISVGVISDSEFMDVEMTENVSCKELIERINEKIPMGLKILDAKRLNESDRPLSKIESAKYLVYAHGTGDNNIEKLLEKDDITVEKKSKKGISLVNIRQDIFDLNYLGAEDETDVFEMHLSAGSSANLKPETVLAAMDKYMGYSTKYFSVKRINMYFENGINIL